MPRRALIHDIEIKERSGRWFPAIAGLLAIALLGATWIGLFTFMSANAAYGTFSDLEQEYIPDVANMELNFPVLSRTSRVYAEEGELLAELHDGRVSEPTPIDEIPDYVIHAVLAAEDKDFYIHEGVDFTAIARAALDNVIFDTRRGGSTITQQVVKQNFVGTEATIQRKITEAFVSAEVERRFTKDQILEFYLNSVFFGSNAYGIKAAAREFFDQPLNRLTVAESATLAVLIRNPSLYNPRRRPDTVLDRRNRVIDEMVDSEWITPAQALLAKRAPLGVVDHRPFQGDADHVVAEIKRQLLDLNDHRWDFLGLTKEDRKQAIFGCPADAADCAGGGGLRIETTINLEKQKEANRILDEWLPLPPYEDNVALCQTLFPNDTIEFLEVYATTHSCSPTGAIASVDNLTGAVVVMASGLPFDFNQFDLAVQGRRNPGSSFKPFTLVAALESGLSLGSYFNGASPMEIQCPYVCSEAGNVWNVSNAGSGVGVITLDQATSSSVNTVYAQVSIEVGPDRIVEIANRMGIQSTLRALPSITLGTSEVSPLEMASAYSNFATNGLYAEPYIISRITDRSGQVLFEHQVTNRQVGDPARFAAARKPLLRVPSSAGTAPRAAIGRPQGGKTGTHQNYQDAWFVGFVPQYSTAVWVGYEAEQIPLRNVTIHGENYARVFGGTVPAPIWAEFMQILVADLEPLDFGEDPPGVESYMVTPDTTVPYLIGLLWEDAELALRDAKLAAEMVEVPSGEPIGVVVGQDLEPAAVVPEGSPIIVEVSNGVAPSAVIPNVTGQTYEDAFALLTEFSDTNRLSLTILREEIFVIDPSFRGRVVAMTPPPGATVGFGTLIRLQVGA